VFFAAVFLAARLATALFLPRYEDVLLLVLVLVAAGVFGNLSGVGPYSGAKGLLLMWAACGPVFPTLLGVVLPSAPGEASTFAALFGVGVLGCALTYPVMRKVADSHVVRGTLSIPMVLGTLLVSATVVLVLLY
jgi:hypothetical protein